MAAHPSAHPSVRHVHDPVLTVARRTPAVGPRRVATRLTVALAVAAAVAGGGSAFVDDVLLGPAVMRGSARGTGVVVLLLGVPVLLAAAAVARRAATSSTPATRARYSPALAVWVGTVAYLVYNAVMFLFGTPFNPLFLVYDAVLGLGIATLVALLAGLDARALAADVHRRVCRPVAAWVAFVAVANTLLWLRGVVPGLGDPAHAAFLDGTGLVTLPTYVQDLAFWLPLALVVAVLLWRRQPWGVVLGRALLVYWTLEAVTVAVDQWMGSHADPSSTVATMGGSYLFMVLTVLGLVPLVALLRPRATT